MTSEAAFKELWLALPDRSDLFQLALEGGSIASNLSFVFIAAYQSAIRECFANLATDRWYCFAASEDRSGELPGVSLTDGKLSGTKTWIASSDCVDEIILTVGTDCFLVPADSPNVAIETVTGREFLGEMSQGRATFSDAIPAAQLEMSGNFGLAEAFYVTTSSAGYLATRFTETGNDQLKHKALDCASRLDRIRLSSPATLLSVHGELKTLGKQCANEIDVEGAIAEDWRKNGRLLAMYGRALGKASSEN